MATALPTNALPKSAPSAMPVVTAAAPSTSAQDIGRAMQLMQIFFNADTKMDPGDLAELAAITGRVMASICH